MQVQPSEQKKRTMGKNDDDNDFDVYTCKMHIHVRAGNGSNELEEYHHKSNLCKLKIEIINENDYNDDVNEQEQFMRSDLLGHILRYN